MKVCFETFGCRLNRAEALGEEAKYLASGWERTTKHSDADLFVISGCSVTAKAQRDCEKLIEHLKKHYPNKRLIVRGCLTTNESKAHAYKQDVGEPLPTVTSRAYLKVQDGCSGKCTFCIVPKFRGASVSMPFGGLLDRAKQYVDAGYHEIVVTGCNLSLYASEGKRLPELLNELAGISPDCRIRLGSLEPSAVAMDTVDVIADCDNLCKHLHIPIQSASNHILSAMQRPYLLRDVEQLILTAITKMPGFALGCDLIAGFPGETEIDYDANKGLLKRFPFVRAHVFPYSERPGTKAVALGNPVPKDLRKHRAHRLTQIADEQLRLYVKRFVGHEVQVVVEDINKGGGWTGEHVWCEAVDMAKTRKQTYKRKSLVTYRVREAHNGQLKGAVV